SILIRCGPRSGTSSSSSRYPSRTSSTTCSAGSSPCSTRTRAGTRRSDARGARTGGGPGGAYSRKDPRGPEGRTGRGSGVAEGQLAGGVALVTGASRGIGWAIAARCAREGAAVAVNYVTGPEPVQGKDNRADAARLVAEVQGAGGRALAVEADVADGAQV